MKRYERLLNRRASLEKRLFGRYNESYEQQTGEDAKYLLGAMAPVDSAATGVLLDQCAKVQNQLATRLAASYPGIAFRKQGSVSNNTHIKYYSDIDLLTIIDRFVSLEPPQTAAYPYAGVPADDLLTLREDCVRHLEAAFPATNLDNSGSTSIELSNSNWACSVDVVPANWYDTVAYSQGQGDHTRGIMVLNKDEMKRHKNYPFLFNHRIELQDNSYYGIPRAMIRLLKSIKADYDDENPNTPAPISSFDLCSIVYRMPTSFLVVPRNDPLKAVKNLLDWVNSLINSPTGRASLMVVDDSRRIFDEEEKVRGLGVISTDLTLVYYGAVAEMRQSPLLTEAHLGM
ncbi:MAG TPA: hypothetical protein VHD32_10905 [Candidatus Didemnitutus sp.]|nr:hypothetical protein [Candidatus Didemnitutus sp.]